MDKSKQVQSVNEKAKEARVPNFQGLQRKSQKSSNSSIGIDQNQKKFYDYINEREQRDKNPVKKLRILKIMLTNKIMIPLMEKALQLHMKMKKRVFLKLQ